MAVIKSGSTTDQAFVSPANALKVDGSAATQPVTGTLIVNQGTSPWVIGDGGNTIDTQEAAANLAQSVTGVSGAAVTATLPAVASDFHYITMIEIVKYAVAAITGTAIPVVVTSTNLPGSLAWTFETAQAIGSLVSKVFVPAKALKSSASNTATTIVCPATTSVIWRINVWYLAAS